MTTIPCPDCEYGKVEMEVRRSRGGDFITELAECPTCKGSNEVEQRNPITEIEIVVGRLTGRLWATITRNSNKRQFEITYRECSAKRLEKLLTDLVNDGQYDVVYEQLTRGVVTFYPRELPY